MSAAAVLQELRTRLGLWEGIRSQETFPCARFPAGFPRGAIVEIAGAGKTESAAAFLAENPTLRAAWIEGNFSLLPSALLQRGVNLEKIFFVEAKHQSAWAAGTILRAGIFPVVVYHAPPPRRATDLERELRRFQLLAEKSATTMLLLSEEPLPRAWPVRLSLTPAGRELVSTRGR